MVTILPNDNKNRIPNSKINVIYYPPGAAGHLLSNCLMLADNSATMSMRQSLDMLDGHFDQDRKFNEMMFRLKGITKGTPWGDLGTPDHLDCLYYEASPHRNIDLKYLIDNNLHIFDLIHTDQEIQRLNKIVNINSIIQFSPSEEFVVRRRSINNFHELHNYTPNKLNHLISKKSYCQVINWTPNDLLTDDYINSIEEIYIKLGLTNFNRDYIIEYIKLWKHKVLGL
jgi:hypothetical protein